MLEEPIGFLKPCRSPGHPVCLLLLARINFAHPLWIKADHIAATSVCVCVCVTPCVLRATTFHILFWKMQGAQGLVIQLGPTKLCMM